MSDDVIIDNIFNAVIRAEAKHPSFADSTAQVVSIATEEIGEMAKAVNDEDLEKAKSEALDLVAVLNSVPFLEDRKHVICILNALCTPGDISICSCCQ